MKSCPKCGKEYGDDWKVCFDDQKPLVDISVATPKVTPKCINCQSEMVRETKKGFSPGLLIFGLFTVLIFAFFPLGFIITIIIIICSINGKTINIWKCPSCGHFFKIA